MSEKQINKSSKLTIAILSRMLTRGERSLEKPFGNDGTSHWSYSSTDKGGHHSRLKSQQLFTRIN